MVAKLWLSEPNYRLRVEELKLESRVTHITCSEAGCFHNGQHQGHQSNQAT